MEDTQYNKDFFYLLGAGGLARELESWLSNTEFSKKYDLKGFIDDNLNALATHDNNYKIVDTFFEGNLWKGKNILIAIARPETKEKAYAVLKENDCNILSFSHSFTVIGNNSILGLGIVLSPFVVISCNVKIGICVTVNSGSQIGHDVVIGDFSSIMANVDIGGGAHIGKNVFIGSNAVILPGVKIPDNTIIGAGSVVLRSVKHSGSYFGNPAKKIF
ncbi:NeuD/PglB/VioB family sugar acetyltransferase [Flavobacterium psychrophilum]|uniref:NeuD/PglB/VioB family sugar acetyltransferase n=1 Tax=Flavobacterium psychrophilum TaxID=96345 RepID=UPI000A373C32|nr:NeuD/PglB/VioB family sugar acetyltransferase [Flavobacterium psychrophilum]EKT3973277.1 NeuD/PglB/VioB family sugar acetyltransferase [Flavobacterium psychrophilum]EKT4525822.1 NeuD/PglB/VioB family sugar acetyltransferase [Flavobacterium psychrophilum]EKT4533927.1 NeuD/PglB/VioB family sugar acetyltransferase [Flavobacterium psychrophilum]EKT4535803.1 NeuD/PglB/VioB family sugar acetyltransferase [Flavobacterium psychrophilum]EKT4570155.1 NeuD/PglB/VioB family sugar acetyltransferase [Fla